MTAPVPTFGHSTDYLRPIRNRELQGSALVIRPTCVESVMTHTFGEREVVIADLYVLDGEHANELENNRKFFSSHLNAALKQVLDKGEGVIVARLNHGHFGDTNGIYRQFWYFTPVNLLTDKEMLVQAEVVAKAQGWM